MTFTIESKKHGSVEVLIDEDDWYKVKEYTWRVSNSKSGFRIKTTIPNPGNHSKRKTPALHNMIVNCPKGMVVDHINHNTLDNRKCNLRICTTQENSRNAVKFYNRTTKSIYKGIKFTNVTCNGKTYHYIDANIHTMGKTLYLGTYKTEIEAARAYDKKAIELFGEFACINGV